MGKHNEFARCRVLARQVVTVVVLTAISMGCTPITRQRVLEAYERERARQCCRQVSAPKGCCQKSRPPGV